MCIYVCSFLDLLCQLGGHMCIYIYICFHFCFGFCFANLEAICVYVCFHFWIMLCRIEGPMCINMFSFLDFAFANLEAICVYICFHFWILLCQFESHMCIYMFSFLDFALPIWRPRVHMCVGRAIPEVGGCLPWPSFLGFCFANLQFFDEI